MKSKGKILKAQVYLFVIVSTRKTPMGVTFLCKLKFSLRESFQNTLNEGQGREV